MKAVEQSDEDRFWALDVLLFRSDANPTPTLPLRYWDKPTTYRGFLCTNGMIF